MTFQKGNKLWDNPNAIKTRIKKGQRLSPNTEFKKGSVPKNKYAGKIRLSLNKYALEKSKILFGKNCLICGLKKRVYPHHIDKNWKNNSLENVVPLCASCHSRLHGLQGNKGQFKKGQIPWNKGFKKLSLKSPQR